MISLSGHKMYGPQGIGALIVRRELHGRIEPLIHGGGQQNGLRSGTLPVPLCVGMGVAASVLKGVEGSEERNRIARQRDRFVELLCNDLCPVVVNAASCERRHPGCANVRFDGLDAHEILGRLQPRLAASTGSACASGISEPSHVLRAIGLNETQTEASVRFSFGRFTTDEEVETAARMVIEAVESVAFTPLI